MFQLNQPFYETKRKELEAHCATALSLLESAVTWSNKEGYIFLNRKDNPEIFEYLDALQFFAFQITNKKREVVSIHQAALWFTRGIFAWRYHSDKVKNGGRTEVHHRDSNPSNNDPSNLCYVTPQQNSLCANAVSKKYHGLRALNSANIKSWSEWGGGLWNTAELIRDCIVQTFKAVIPESEIPSAANIFMQLPAKTGTEIIRFWQLDLDTRKFGAKLKAALAVA